jgi:hypothetical protein
MSQMKAIADKLLSNVSNGYFPTGLIAEKVLPFIQSKNTSGKLGAYGTAHLRVERALAGGRAEARRVETKVYSTSSYEIEDYALEDVVTERDYANVEEPFDAEEDTTIGLTSLINISKEKALADALSSTSVLTQYTTLVGTDQFSDANNSDPLAVAATARSTVKSGCGLPPDTLIMSWEVAQKLKFHPVLVDYLGFKMARPGGLSYEELATAFEVKRILIGEASYESAKEGQTSALLPIWGDIMVFGVLPESAAKRQISGGYIFGHKKGETREVFKRDIGNPVNSKAIIVRDQYDIVITQAAAMYLVKDCLA